ncbi:MAG: hypothetical protein ACYC6W_02830 [Nitrosotalea sp.]
MKFEHKILLLIIGIIAGCFAIMEPLQIIPDTVFSQPHSGLISQFATILYAIRNVLQMPFYYVFQYTVIALVLWSIITLRHKIRSTVWKFQDTVNHEVNPET